MNEADTQEGTQEGRQDLVVRPLSPGDHDAWWPLWRGYLEFYRTELPEETVRETWRRLLDPAEPMHGALAWRGGAAVGLVHHLTHRSFWTVGDYCYLQDLFVAPAARGTGLGRTLIRHVYDRAAAAGCSRVHWLTHETNAQAMQLYDRIAERPGFVQYRHLL